MSLAWLLLGAVIGVFNGLGDGKGSGGMVAMMLGGMIVLPVPGVLLALIGGDALGSVAGAAAGLFGCWLVGYGGAAAVEPQGMSVIIVISALLGATGFLFLRFLLWKYTLIFAAICWLLRSAPVPARARILAGHHLLTRRRGIPFVPSTGQTRHSHSPDRPARSVAASAVSSR
jgi:hypothetical protein